MPKLTYVKMLDENPSFKMWSHLEHPRVHKQTQGLFDLKNKAGMFLYKNIAKRIFFLIDPERVHNVFIDIGRIFGSNFITKKIISFLFNYQNRHLEQDILGIHFRNPVGLSAGFDKNAEIISVIEDVGFGFTEVGSITAKPYGGNAGKRLDRFVKEKSIWVNYGLSNKGADAIYNKLKDKKFKIPIGINIAKTNCKKCAEAEKGIKDYIASIKKFAGIGDYIDINISCPNSFGGQDFAKSELYEQLLSEIGKLKIKKPVFVKLSPDLDKKTIDRIIEISEKYAIAGFICSNLTKRKNKYGKGGLSGKAVEKKANELISYIYKKTGGEFIIIGAGGIFSAEDAYKKIRLGASLVQLITGMIFEGPNIIGEINYGLTKLLKRDGYENISEAIGKDVNKMRNIFK